MTTNAQISAVVDLLMIYRGKSRQELADVLGISLKTLGRRLRAELGWEADEVALMADFFDTSIVTFFDGPDALMSGAAKRAFWTPSVGVLDELVDAA